MRPPSFTKPQALSRLRALQQFQPRTLHPTITTLSCSSSPPLTSSYSSTRSFSLTPSLQKSNRATFDRVPNDAHPRRKLELVNMLTKSNWVLSPHPISPERSCISQTFCFKGFSKAFRFIRAMAKKAKDLQHHPEWSNVYNLVHVRWTTHDDPSGLTHKDFEMAWYCGVVARQLNSEGGGDKPWIRELEREEVEVLRGLVDEVAEEASKAKGLDEVKKKEEGEEEVGDTNNANVRDLMHS
ncbi:hypothetical protein QBC44DRAFT_115108 [Cladorrhinum sp. PSN332]|nr:hypothetical protein QBC44DRAFT_115108 [Cladorrhinum sp. PSN332]